MVNWIISENKVGEFECESGIFLVSDPYFEKNELHKMVVLQGIMTGTWEAYIVTTENHSLGTVVTHLKAKHSSFKGCKQSDLENLGREACVQTRQIGIFDKKYFKDYSVFHPYNNEINPSINQEKEWFKHCCLKVLSEEQAGVIPFGMVGFSTSGACSYNTYFHLNIDCNVDYIEVELQIPEYDKDEYDWDADDDLWDIDWDDIEDNNNWDDYE